MGRFSTRGEVARRERVEYALVRCTQLSTVVSDPRSTIHGPLPPLFFVKKEEKKIPTEPEFVSGGEFHERKETRRRFPFARTERRKERRGGRSEKRGQRKGRKSDERRRKRAAWKVVKISRSFVLLDLLLPLFEDTLKRRSWRTVSGS